VVVVWWRGRVEKWRGGGVAGWREGGQGQEEVGRGGGEGSYVYLRAHHLDRHP